MKSSGTFTTPVYPTFLQLRSITDAAILARRKLQEEEARRKLREEEDRLAREEQLRQEAENRRKAAAEEKKKEDLANKQSRLEKTADHNFEEQIPSSTNSPADPVHDLAETFPTLLDLSPLEENISPSNDDQFIASLIADTTPLPDSTGRQRLSSTGRVASQSVSLAEIMSGDVRGRMLITFPKTSLM